MSPSQSFKAIEGKGVQATIDGQTTFVGNDKLLNDVSVSDDLKRQMTELQNQAKTVVFVGQADRIIGLIAIQDAPKPTSKDAISALKSQGLKTVMLTGDNLAVSQAIANEVGIDQVVADVLPADKADQVKKFQESGKVAFVGDGINDAPALSTADVGIAMGSGTDIAIESGGIVLVKNDLRDVYKALELSKKTFNRIKLNLFWAFVYNVLGIPVAAGVFYFIGLALSPSWLAWQWPWVHCQWSRVQCCWIGQRLRQVQKLLNIWLDNKKNEWVIGFQAYDPLILIFIDTLDIPIQSLR